MKKIYDLLEDFPPPLRRIYPFFKFLSLFIAVCILNIQTGLSKDNEKKSAATEMQQVTVTGTVIDSQTNEPMPGVNIQVKGTTIGTITDAAGRFSLPVANTKATLVFSFIGYVAQEIPLEGRVNVSVSLVSETLGLDEVVVVGYATAKKETLSGSVAAIKAADIVSMKTSSVATMVQGKVPGLMIRKRTGEPGTYNSYISVRGFGAPLLVIDGVIRDGMSDFERLNPQDIESISVLKDAAAAIYGMNSDNGVLIVNTKTGTRGETKINYSTTYSWKQPTSQGYQNTVDAYTFRLMKNEMARNYDRVEPYSAEVLEKWRVGTEPGFTDFDWYNATIRDGIGGWSHNVSFSGGNDVLTHYTSFGYLQDDGLLSDNRSQNYKKYNIRTAFDANIAKGLTFKVKVAGKIDDRYNPPQTFFWIFKQMLVSDRGIGPYTLANPNHYSVVPTENINVFAKMSKDADGYVRNKNYQYQLTGELNYDVPSIKGLSLNVLGAYDGNLLQYTQFRGSFILYDYLTDAPGGATQATIEERMTNMARTNVQGKITFRRTLAQNHNVSALFVSEVRQIQTKDVGGKRQYDDIFTNPIIDQASTTNQTTRGGLNTEAYISYIGRFNYDYKSKYLVEFAFREDGSYRYSPNKRWAFFPSASIGWRVSEEAFIKNNLPMISNLKFRASYGQMGSDAGNAFQYYQGYTLGGIQQGAILSPGKLTLGMIPPGVVNDYLSWVTATTTNIGMDLSLWKGKLGFVADIFQKDREGLLATRASAVPNTFGASFPQENLNSDRVRGFELELSHRNTFRGINFGASANVTYSRTYLMYRERSPYQSTWEIWKDGNNADGRIQGRAWLYQQDGIVTDITEYETLPLIGGTNGNSRSLPGTQRVVDLNGDGRISGEDQMPELWAQDVNPPLQFGSNLSASWKGLDINMLLQGAALYSLRIAANDTWGYLNWHNTWAFWLDRWVQADPSVNPFDPAAEWIPGKYAPLQASWSGTLQNTTTKLWAKPANYLRIKNLELGYTLPNNLTSKVFLKDVRLAVSVVNLATFTNKELKRFDPERESGDYNAGLTYPLLREFNFTLSVNF